MAEPTDPGVGISLVAHDLKNTFHLMTLALEELQQHLPNEEPATRTLLEMRWFLSHVDYLATTLLDTVRADALERRAILLNAFLADHEPQLSRILTRGVALVVRPSAHSGSVLATPAELERLLLTLVSHACAAMPDGGEVTISTGWLDQVAGVTLPSVRPRRYVRLTVSDTGERSDRDPNAELLNPPLVKGTDEDPAYSIAVAVRRLNGWLIVENEDGTGTRVHVCLPALPDPAEV